MAVTQGSGVPEGFEAEATRRHVAGVVHTVLFRESKSGSRSILHVEPHRERGAKDPSGDLVVRVDGIGGAWRLTLEPYEEPF